MIPKIIWQTYECSYEELLPEIKEFTESWKNKNKNWEYRYMSSDDRNSFVLNNFGEEWFKIFNSCELGIVKANIWRCMVLYIYGGVYCDLDTICNEPIDTWIKDEYQMTCSKDDQGNSNEYAINVFASKPNSDALNDILNALKYNIINKKINKDNVIALTGETLWKNIIRGREIKYNVYCYKQGSNIFNGLAVTHLGPIKKWDEKGYVQWTKG